MVATAHTRFINVAAIAFAASAVLVAGGNGAAHAANKLVATVSISHQTMAVSVDGRTAFEWKVSTARRGYVTPRGAFKPTRLERMWYSRKYDMSPMPHAVFFAAGGIAFHEGPLDVPSHGCVHLAAADAIAFFDALKPGNEVDVW